MMFEGKMHGLESYLTQIKTFTPCLLTYTQNLSAFFSLSRLKRYFSSSSSTPTAFASLPSNQLTYKRRRLCLEDQSGLKRSALLIITDLYAVFTLFFTHTNMKSTFACTQKQPYPDNSPPYMYWSSWVVYLWFIRGCGPSGELSWWGIILGIVVPVGNGWALFFISGELS